MRTTAWKDEWNCANPWDWEPEIVAMCGACGATVCDTEAAESESLADDEVADAVDEWCTARV